MGLKPREWDILKAIDELGGSAEARAVAERAGIKLSTLMSDAVSLAQRGFLIVREERTRRAELTDEGLRYLREGLPERRLIKALEELGGEARPGDVKEKAGLSDKELAIALGWARKKRWALIERGSLKLLEAPESTPEEEALKLIASERKDVGELVEKGLRDVLLVLEKRGLIRIMEETRKILELTEEGRRALQMPRPVEEVGQLTPELIISGRWRQVRFKRFNVEAPGKPVYPGRLHPVQELIREIREIFLEMGFEEIRGPLVETAFWNFDALFTPQDHPAREMHDTFYLAEPTAGDLPGQELVMAVARTHEDGWRTGSTGWGYKWRPEEARKLVMRTHTTATTIRYLAEHPEPPVWVFSVDRVYRNERVDYKHLAEFFKKLGFEKVRFWPSYFPYTEPSLQSTVYSPELGAWVSSVALAYSGPRS